MASHQIRNLIFGLTGLWIVLGVLLAVATFMQWVDKTLFSNLFIGGFIVYCVIIAILSQLLSGTLQDEQDQDRDDS
ncbi:hypothetical protein [Acanthopleuribacter pedis]|uniref:Uncharacterized protein n=1 Tax=Acanthopleuribacter pedis TaxID=442870 RepID=A0A8J7Q9S8_9BACT|nr:hypothetical protein [Acanthopleuribacter pedis]MBO1319609.1 hypothetical protein [Acanthopleuribacter pedis]